MQTNDQVTGPIVVTSTKNVGVSILLTILFGSLGMLYSTIPGAIIMTILSLIVAVLTAGLGLLIMWPISVVWGAMAASSYNKKLLKQASSF